MLPKIIPPSKTSRPSHLFSPLKVISPYFSRQIFSPPLFPWESESIIVLHSTVRGERESVCVTVFLSVYLCAFDRNNVVFNIGGN